MLIGAVHCPTQAQKLQAKFGGDTLGNPQRLQKGMKQSQSQRPGSMNVIDMTLNVVSSSQFREKPDLFTLEAKTLRLSKPHPLIYTWLSHTLGVKVVGRC